MTKLLTQKPADLKRNVADDFRSPALLAEVAKVLPKHLSAERLLRVTQTMVLFKPELVACTRDSLRRCVLICAQAGLEPDGRLAHIVAFKDQAQVIFDWKGLVALASRNNIQVSAKLVYAGDKFEVLEDDGEGRTRVNHSADYTRERGEIVAVYSRAKMQDGTVDYEIMSADEVESVRQDFSRAKDSAPWVKSWGEMAKKTVIKRHSKRWNLMPEIRDVLYADDDNLPGVRELKPMTRPVFTNAHTTMLERVAEGAELEKITGEPSPQYIPGVGHLVLRGDEPPQKEPEETTPVAPSPTPSKPQEGGKAREVAAPKPSKPAKELKMAPAAPAQKSGPIVVRELLKSSGLIEQQLIGFLAAIELVDPGTPNLEEVDLANDGLLAQVAEQWSEFVQRVREFDSNPIPE